MGLKSNKQIAKINKVYCNKIDITDSCGLFDKVNIKITATKDINKINK